MGMYAVMKVEPRAWHMLGKHSTTGYILSLNMSFKKTWYNGFTLPLI